MYTLNNRRNSRPRRIRPPASRFDRGAAHHRVRSGRATSSTRAAVRDRATTGPSNHGIYADSKEFVWIGGNGGIDGHVLKFTRDGKFVKQFGFQYPSAGSNDVWAFSRVAKVFSGQEEQRGVP